MTNRMSAVLLGLTALCWPGYGLADSFQLVRDPGGAFVANSRVRIETGAGMDAFTDQLGRMIVNLPSGSYRATVDLGGRSVSFQLDVDGRPDMKVYHLPF